MKACFLYSLIDSTFTDSCKIMQEMFEKCRCLYYDNDKMYGRREALWTKTRNQKRKCRKKEE